MKWIQTGKTERPIAGFVAAAAALGMLPTLLAPKAVQAGPTTPPASAKKSAAVYVCKECKLYFSASAAKKMGYKDGEGHKMTKMAKAPAGFTNGSKMPDKMDKMSKMDKMDKMSGDKKDAM